MGKGAMAQDAACPAPAAILAAEGDVLTGPRREAPMSTGLFLLVFIGLGFAVLTYFNRRAKNQGKRRPGEKNPIDFWLYGRDTRDDDER